MVTLLIEYLSSPIGVMLLLSDEQNQLRALDWQDYESRMQRLLRVRYGADVQVVRRASRSTIADKLNAYFAGDLHAIEAIAVQTTGTPFQRSVWQALREIPVGSTWSYGALAARIGRPKAVRAVGLANGSNPIGLVVPCHRVIGADDSLTGYGGGLERKRWLLNHEKAQKQLML